MPSISVTRRRLLTAGGVALLGGLAGCNDSTHDVSSPPEQPENVELNPDAVSLRRSDEDAPAAWYLPEDETPADATAEPSEDIRQQHQLIATPEAANRIKFADVDGRETAREFIDETAFDHETLYLQGTRMRECFTLRLCYVTWSATEIDTQYGSYYRDAEVACRTDTYDRASWLIRIPDTLNPTTVRSRGSGWSSNGCTYPPPIRNVAAENTTASPTNATNRRQR